MKKQNNFIRRDKILPKGVTPAHLVIWAEKIDEEKGCVSKLTETLREIARNISKI